MVKTAKEFYDEHYSDDPVVIMKDYAKMLTDRMYSEEKVLKIIRQYALEEHLITSSKPDKWFEQFKKIQNG